MVTASLAVGAAATPTPTGEFYVDISVANPGGSYGEWMLSVAGFSNVQVVMSGEWPGAISHFWSLAVEEQFYLAWPWLIVFAPRRWLGPASPWRSRWKALT